MGAIVWLTGLIESVRDLVEIVGEQMPVGGGAVSQQVSRTLMLAPPLITNDAHACRGSYGTMTSEFAAGALFHEKRYEVADAAGFEPGVLLADECVDG